MLYAQSHRPRAGRLECNTLNANNRINPESEKIKAVAAKVLRWLADAAGLAIYFGARG